MKIYKCLADYYQYIFPAGKKIEFLGEEFQDGGKLLDVGCSDGRVAKGLSDRGYLVDAFDLSEDMVRVAKEVSEEDFNVSIMDMNDVDKYFKSSNFDGIYCIGNTLVHLRDYSEIEEQLKKFKSLIKENGKLVIQILNYDYIYNSNVENLPLINNKKVEFKRFYILENKRVTFKTKLKIKDTNEDFEAETILFPIRKDSLENSLKNAGFNNFSYYGGFDRKEWTSKSMPLIVVAQ